MEEQTGRTPEVEAKREQVLEEEARARRKEGEEAEAQRRVYVEEREVRGGQLMDTIENLLRESSVRRIRLKGSDGRILLDIPVWAATIGGATAVIAAPIISAIAALGGLLAGITVEVEREAEEKT